MANNDPFDPDRWQTNGEPVQTPALPRKRKRPSRARRPDRFLKGPIPWPWLMRAIALPGKALAVGLMLWLQSGITCRRTVLFCLARAAADGGEGAAIGAGAGAGAGATSEIITGGDQVKVPSETFLDFTLQQDVSIPTPSS